MQAPGSIGTSQQGKQLGSNEPTPVQGGDSAPVLRVSHGRRADMAESESEQLALATPLHTPKPAEAVTPGSELSSTPFSPFSPNSPFSAHVSTEARVQLAARAAAAAPTSPLASSLPNLPATARREALNGDSPYRGRSHSGNSSNNSTSNNSNNNSSANKPSRSPSPVKALHKTTTLRSLSSPACQPTATSASNSSSGVAKAEPPSPRPRPYERAFPISPPKLHAESLAATPAASNDTTQAYTNTVSLMGLLTKVPDLLAKSKPVAAALKDFAAQLLEEHPDRKALRDCFDRFRGALEYHVVARSLLAQIEGTIGFLPELSPEKPDPRLSGLRRQVADALAEYARLACQ